MITDSDITKLKETFATGQELKEEIAGVRLEVGEVNDKIDTLASAIGRIENTLDGIAGAIHDQQIENGAGAVHLARHDRHIAALAIATNVALPD